MPTTSTHAMAIDDDPILTPVENVLSKERQGKKKTTSSSTTGSNDGGPTSNKVAKGIGSQPVTPDQLRLYYSRLFPTELLHEWLSYGKENSVFAKREFSFTIEPTKGEEIYLRYRSFHSQADFAQNLAKTNPIKIDIGAVFEASPSDSHAVQSKKNLPVQRELVFDVDMDEYDQVRYCGCKGANICPKCWEYMKMAMVVMDDALRHDFGFQHIQWFFSGRRGVHAWVCDESARFLTDEGRSAVANYFMVDLGSDKNQQVNLTQPLHPLLSRAYELLEPFFLKRILPKSGQGLLATPEGCDALLELLPEAANEVRRHLQTHWSGKEERTKPQQKWNDLKQCLETFVKAHARTGKSQAATIMTAADRARLEQWPMEVVFRHGYPRLDVNVSKTRNHLLKSPFCVHPKTGRVCVPIYDFDDFDPFQVPTLSEILEDLSQDTTTEETRSSTAAWERTRLRPYYEPFRTKFLSAMASEMRQVAKDAAEQAAAAAGDF